MRACRLDLTVSENQPRKVVQRAGSGWSFTRHIAIVILNSIRSGNQVNRECSHAFQRGPSRNVNPLLTRTSFSRLFFSFGTRAHRFRLHDRPAKVWTQCRAHPAPHAERPDPSCSAPQHN